MKRSSLLALSAFCQLSLLLACQQQEAAAPAPASPPASSPSAPVVRDGATTLLFSFTDAQGRLQTVPTPDAVPVELRAHVLVIDLAQTAEQRQAQSVSFFVDLTKRNADGSYVVTAVPRARPDVNSTGSPR